jgi:hypothetical protein
VTTHSLLFLILTVAVPAVITETLLLFCWRTFGEGGAYPWYSCLLRTAVYSPCMVVGVSGLITLPLGAAFYFKLRGSPNQIVWLYGLPEIFVGMVCVFISLSIRLINRPAR